MKNVASMLLMWTLIIQYRLHPLVFEVVKRSSRSLVAVGPLDLIP